MTARKIPWPEPGEDSLDLILELNTEQYAVQMFQLLEKIAIFLDCDMPVIPQSQLGVESIELVKRIRGLA